MNTTTKTFMQTVFEMQESVIPTISMKKANNICAQFNTSLSDVMMSSLAIHHLIDIGLVDGSTSDAQMYVKAVNLLNENNVQLGSDIAMCRRARAAIYEAEVKKDLAKMAKNK